MVANIGPQRPRSVVSSSGSTLAWPTRSSAVPPTPVGLDDLAIERIVPAQAAGDQLQKNPAASSGPQYPSWLGGNA